MCSYRLLMYTSLVMLASSMKSTTQRLLVSCRQTTIEHESNRENQVNLLDEVTLRCIKYAA